MLDQGGEMVKPDRAAVVVGAGVIGLTTALRLLEAGWRVRVVAAELPGRTTSDTAAAIWYPYGIGPMARVLPWAERSYAVYLQQARDGVPGVYLRRGMELFRSPRPEPGWAGTVGDFAHPAPDRLPDGYA